MKTQNNKTKQPKKNKQNKTAMKTNIKNLAAEKIEQISNQITERCNKDIDIFQKKIENLQQLQVFYTVSCTKANSIIKSLSPVLQKMGLEINTFGIGKTGMDSNVLAENDKCTLSLRILPTPESKFRGIQFAGYTESGRSKNYKRLQESAEKMKNTILQNLDTTLNATCQVNPFSLEANENGGVSSILIDLWF